MPNKTILLVDDESELLAVNQETLESQGYRVCTAGNGLDALSMLQSEAVDLVVTDLRMPKLGGRELLAEMRAQGLETDVIFLTGYGTVQSAVECIQQGAVDYLLKPYDIREFLEKISKVLQEQELRSATPAPANKLSTDLDRVLDLGSALRNQRDMKALAKELLVQMREAFAPDSMALFLDRSAAREVGSRVLWGETLGANKRVADWFEAVARKLMERGRPKLFDSLAVNLGGKRTNVTALVAPIIDARGALGAAVVIRDVARGVYAMPSLQMLTVFADHTATALGSLSAQCRLQGINLEIIASHVRSVELKDVYTKGHSERVGAFAARLGQAMGLGANQCEQLSFAGVLHDVGKIGIPDNILNKPNSLSPAEFEIMKQHPVLGRDILTDVSSLRDLLPIVYHHHEWFNGLGYPDGLRGDSIPLLARIISVVDGFEAMTSDRAYQTARTHAEALDILKRGAGEQWDESVVYAWVEELDKGDLGVDDSPLNRPDLVLG